jgi:hypothetical protein
MKNFTNLIVGGISINWDKEFVRLRELWDKLITRENIENVPRGVNCDALVNEARIILEYSVKSNFAEDSEYATFYRRIAYEKENVFGSFGVQINYPNMKKALLDEFAPERYEIIGEQIDQYVNEIRKDSPGAKDCLRLLIDSITKYYGKFYGNYDEARLRLHEIMNLWVNDKIRINNRIEQLDSEEIFHEIYHVLEGNCVWIEYGDMNDKKSANCPHCSDMSFLLKHWD